MNMMKFRRMLSVILCTVLIAAMALIASGCGNSGNAAPATAQESTAAVTTAVETIAEGLTEEASVEATASTETADPDLEASVLGEGQTQFTLEVVDADGNTSLFEIHTDAPTVGEALTELALIEGEESDFGLYVKTVNGITYDFDKDGKYWAFYIDGEYASTGVDATEITDGSTYALKAE